MTQRTRLFLMIAAGVLAVGLVTGLVASFMGLPALALQGGDGPDELKYIPADARVVAYANVRDVMNSQLRQRLHEMRPEPENRQNDFEEKTGIDIERDIDEVVAAIGAGVDEREIENPLVLARGRFDLVRIEGLIRQHGGEVVEYKDTRMLTHADRRRDRTLAVAFMEPGLVALGSEHAVREAIDRKTGGQNVTSNDELMGLVRDLDDGNAWAVGRFDAIASRARLPREVASQIPPINWFAASGHVNGGVSGVIRAEARDEQAAQNLRDVVRGFMALARLQANARPEMTAMMDSLQLGGQGKTVSLAFSLPTEVIEMLGAISGHHRGDDPDPDPDIDIDIDVDVDAPEPPIPPAPPAPPRPPRF